MALMEALQDKVDVYNAICDVSSATETHDMVDCILSGNLPTKKRKQTLMEIENGLKKSLGTMPNHVIGSYQELLKLVRMEIAKAIADQKAETKINRGKVEGLAARSEVWVTDRVHGRQDDYVASSGQRRKL